MAPDLMRRMKGADGNRGLPIAQSPYLALADKFLGPEAQGAAPEVSPHDAPGPTEEGERKPLAMAAAASAGMPGMRAFPKPPVGRVVPKPPRLAGPKPAARPHAPKPPRINPPKPPKWM